MLHRVRRLERLLLLVLPAATLVLLQMAAVPREPGARPGGRQMPPPLAIGQKASDVELPRLALTKAKDGTLLGALSSEKVKLSSVWPKKPLCVFLSSYT